MVARSLHWQRIALGLALAASAVAFTRATLDVFNTLKATLIVLAAIAALAVGAVRVARTRRLAVPRTPALWALAAFAVAIVLATVTADTPALALVGRVSRHTGAAMYLTYAALFLLAVRVHADHPPDGIVRALLVTAVPVTAYGVLQVVGADPLAWNLIEGGPAVFSTFGNANFFSAWLGLVMPLAVLGALRRGWSSGARAACGALAAAALAVALASGSHQGPAAGLAGSALVVGVWVSGHPAGTRVHAWRWALAGGALAACVGGAAALTAGIGPLAGLRDSAARSLQTRVGKWEAALAMAGDRPLLGFGLESFQDWFHRYRSPRVAIASGLERTTDAPHNVPLDMLASGGVLLLAAYSAVVVVTAWALVRGLRRLAGAPRLLLGGLGGAWLAYQLQSLVSIDVPPLAVAGWVLGGAVVALGSAPAVAEIRLPGAPEPVRSRPGGKRGGRGKRTKSASAAHRNGRTPRLVPGNPALLGAVAVLAAAAAWAATLPLRADAAARDATVAGTEAEAVTEIRRAAALAPWESRYPARLGAMAMRGDDHAAAVDAYREALDREPRGLAHTINFGRAAALAGQEDLADATYARLLELDPHTPEILVEVAAYHLEQGRTDRAEALLGEAVALRDDEARWWVALGEAREAQGDTDGAADAFTRALELDPDAEFAPDAEGAATNGE